MKNYLGKLDHFILELRKSSLMSNIIFKKNEGVSPGDFIDLEEQFSISISKDIKAFYSELNGFELGWEYHTEKLDKQHTYIEGFIRILSFYEMMMGFDGRLWRHEIWDENTPEKDLAFYKRLKVFDYFGKDNVHCVCLELSEKNMLSDKLWIFRQGSKPVPMNIDVPQYLDKLILTKGFWGWQYFFSESNFLSQEFEGVKSDIGLALANYSEIFTDNSFVELTALYNTKMKKS